MRRGAIVLATIAAAACGAGKNPSRIPEGDGPLVAVYRAEITGSTGASSRKARLLVWAAAPDRLHAELLPPIGGSPVTLDAGEGRAVLVDVSERTAYVGEGGPDAVASLTGVRIGVADAVDALLTGASPEGARIEREGGAEGALPDRFSIEVGGAKVALTRLRWERGASGDTEIGTGIPPPGWRVRPLAEWER
ncbi:MAG TPA: hypothetical protein VJ826_14070 [Candidatus Polarisedimenticolaceae bacterium]|nr:hypothetical protein [Candidatus Polarisedimenticolaceae bacterium]